MMISIITSPVIYGYDGSRVLNDRNYKYCSILGDKEGTKMVFNRHNKKINIRRGVETKFIRKRRLKHFNASNN